MKFSLIVMMVCLGSLAQSKETAGRPEGVPAGAVAIEGHTWRWVDAKGKAWLYRPTPFGVMKSAEPAQTVAKRPAGVPVEALPVSEGVWRWIDGRGKAWMFQETPAGLMKTEEAAAKPGVTPTGVKVAETRTDATLDLITVKDEGETLRFSRPGPFGTYSWVKKKSELDKDEMTVWQRSRKKTGGN